MNNIPCRFFSSPGGCRYGNACRYSHNGSGGACIPVPSQSQQSSYTKPKGTLISYTSWSADGTTKGDTPCRFFSSPAGCRYGDKCFYKHEGKGGGTNESEKDKEEEIEEVAPSADIKDELAVFGYVRDLEACIKKDDDENKSILNLLESDSIPRELITLCVKFYSIIIKWDSNRKYYNKSIMDIISEGSDIKQIKTGWGSAMLNESISSGLHHYKFKLNSLDSRRGYYVLIGIWKTKSGEPLLDTFFTDKKDNGYALNVIDGTLTDPRMPGCGGIKYSTYCKAGDIIDMIVDLDNDNNDDNGTLTYAINGQYYGNGAKIEKKCSYRIAITMYWEGDQIRFISHDNDNPFQ